MEDKLTARVRVLLLLAPISFLLSGLTGCSVFPQAEAGPQQSGQSRPDTKIPSVDVAIARAVTSGSGMEQVGTTNPVREVSLRSQVEGRLLNLTVDVGDRVTQGQILGRLDESLLVAAANQAEAELASLESEIARAEAQVSNARTQFERARLELQQAQNDAERFTRLAQEGAINQQQAESSQTAARVAQQAVLSAQQQIRTEEKAVAAAQGRVAAQNAAIAQAQERLSYAKLVSPINGIVLERTSEPGNLVSPGGEVLKLGDFSRIKVVVPVSELDLSEIRKGQAVQVRLDAFARESFAGTVSRISPAADPTARQIPVEVTIENTAGRIGSGLLARVSFQPARKARVVIPSAALQIGQEQTDQRSTTATVFVVKTQPAKDREPAQDREPAAKDRENAKQARVEARTVTLGQSRQPNQTASATATVEILSGLQPGERFIVRSSQPLNGGDRVQLSILSE